jgi:hypothetical protein
LPSAFGSAAAQPAAPHGARVDGSNLSRVDFAEGRFELRDGRWAEYGRDGGLRFRFEETGRDEWSVYLIDRSRNVALQLDVFRRMVTVVENGRVRGDLYPITDAFASPEHAGKPDAGGDADGGDYAAAGAFYRQYDLPAVAFQFADTLHCIVQNPSQMNAYGGFDRVRIVHRLAMRGDSIGTCGWPNGFYRRSSEPHVYRLFGPGYSGLGRRACHVINPAQMALFGGFGRVVTVEPSSDLFRGREQPTECSDPDISG